MLRGSLVYSPSIVGVMLHGFDSVCVVCVFVQPHAYKYFNGKEFRDVVLSKTAQNPFSLSHQFVVKDCGCP